MRKTVMISFRTSQELKDCLDRIVSQSNGSRSSMIEVMLRDFLSRNQEKWAQAPDSMGPRGPCIMEEERDRSEKHVYLLLGGVRIGLPKNLQSRITLDEKTGGYQIEFAVPEEMNIPSPEGPARGTKREMELPDPRRIKEKALNA